jgi:transmembrane sensor
MNAQVLDEAAHWLIEFRTDEPDAITRDRFATWLRLSPEHVGAYLKLAAVWEDAGGADLARELDLESLIALGRAGRNVVGFPSVPGPESSRSQSGVETPLSPSVLNSAQATVDISGPHPAIAPTSMRPRRYYLAAAASLVALAGATLGWWVLNQDPTYATQVGEQRTLALADGSSVELNALSRIRVHFSDHERGVELLGGQALFTVAHSRARPFVVMSADTRVRAVGTQFDVNRKAHQTTVTVVQGRVAVFTPEAAPLNVGSGAHAPPAVELGPGEQVTVAARAVSHPHRANLATATAWTQQQLIFESTPLAEAAEDFNRFNTRRLRVEGAELGSFHVSGTFAARDPASLSRFVLFLRDQPGIAVQESDDQIVVRQK